MAAAGVALGLVNHILTDNPQCCQHINHIESKVYDL